MSEELRPLRRSPRSAPGWTAPQPERIDLGQTNARLRRALRRAIARRMGVALLPEAQVELITLVHDSPGIRVNEAAGRLGVAANTVSTLVGRLVAADLLERTADPSDARGGCLRLTAAAESRVASWRGHRAAVINEALSRLDIADGAAIEAALPAMWRLGGLLDVLDDG